MTDILTQGQIKYMQGRNKYVHWSPEDLARCFSFQSAGPRHRLQRSLGYTHSPQQQLLNDGLRK